MVETWSVVILIVGIIMGFSGAFIGLAAASVRKPLQVLAERVDKHDERIGHLERRDAGREKQIENIMSGISDLKQMLLRHEDRA